MISEFKKEFAKIELNDGKKLRWFGIIVGAIFAGIGQFTTLENVSLVLVIIGLLLIIPALFAPTILKTPYKYWMRLAIILGFFVSRVLLSLLFYVIITPIGLILKIFRKDLLGLKMNKKSPTYWIARASKDWDEQKKSYSKMFS